jgi:ABC-type cobalamin/Fe3+-siderophores transport system ATPase subunit
MDKLKIDFENCFGIGKLNHEFDFTKSQTYQIYAPNGTMKTSFAKTFDLISKNDVKNLPCDKVYNSRIPKFDILTDDIKINPDNILVINAEDNNFDASSKISTFLASKDLKKQYDEIYLDLNYKKSEFIKKLKSVSQSTDCETEFINTFSENTNTPFFVPLLNQLGDLKDKFDKIQFKYNDVFDKKGNVKKFLDKNQVILDQYINNYKDLLSKSKFFKESANNPFGTYQANEIIKSIEDNSFFEAGHKFILEDGTEIHNSEQLKKIIEEEIQNILNDEKLKQAFEKVDKAIGSNLELRSFQKVIEKDNSMLVNLKDYEKFKKEVWINYLSEIKQDAQELAKSYNEHKKELERIIEESKKEFSLWKKIIKTFNDRFYVPFKVILENQEDIILKQETGNLKFDYSDRNDPAVRQNRNNLLAILSKGEQRAYFILQFLFEIESRKLSTEKHLLIFDDVADSFDYKNKFAIIEYIYELHRLDSFRIIILTHNFDFYRTVASRLYLDWNAVYMTTKSENKEILLHKGIYRNDVFPNFIGRYSEPKIFISLIAFVRNIIEYTESNSCEQYLILTSCLHKKASSSNLTADDIFNIYTNRLVKLQGKTIQFGNKKLIQLIIETAESICNEDSINEILLENKITLAIAIRLKAEEYLITKLPELDLSTINKNQTHVLYQEYHDKFPESNSLDVLDKVNLMTPENIHINAFMFEPLIDMSVYHLIDLYKETTNLNIPHLETSSNHKKKTVPITNSLFLCI